LSVEAVITQAMDLVRGVAGSVIECGIGEGRSAMAILEAVRPTDRKVYLVDSFNGLPDISVEDGCSSVFYTGQYRCDPDRIKRILGGYKDIRNMNIFAGVIPEFLYGLADNNFAFAHVDLDLYKGTIGALKFIVPRLSRWGGFLLVHDISQEGVAKAVKEYFKIDNLSWGLLDADYWGFVRL